METSLSFPNDRTTAYQVIKPGEDGAEQQTVSFILTPPFLGCSIYFRTVCQEKKDYYPDLLFYHLHLRCIEAIDLKVEEFKPEFASNHRKKKGRFWRP